MDVPEVAKKGGLVVVELLTWYISLEFVLFILCLSSCWHICIYIAIFWANYCSKSSDYLTIIQQKTLTHQWIIHPTVYYHPTTRGGLHAIYSALPSSNPLLYIYIKSTICMKITNRQQTWISVVCCKRLLGGSSTSEIWISLRFFYLFVFFSLFPIFST